MVVHHDVPVLVVGGGPAGMLAARQLSRNGVPCLVAERNLDTTKWPKMDITNCRSMELLKRLDIDQGLRSVGVPQNFNFDVLFSTGLSDGGEMLSKWVLDSPEIWRKTIAENNDGSMPREPYQRCSQAIFEAWLKPRIEADPLITAKFGLKFESLVETEDSVTSTLVDMSGEKHIVKSSYVVGCDGAGSKVRHSIGISMTGGPVPGAMYLVHFKSRDMECLHRQGQFWHIFFTSGHVLIAQDEKDTWTLHIPVPLTAKVEDMDPLQEISKGLGAEMSPMPISVDKILVTSIWRPNIYLADRYVSDHCRVFLSGDSAHQNIPTGGYGMNTAVGDSFDIGWKLAAAVRGYGGRPLLQSYEDERRPVGMRNIDRSGAHFGVHFAYVTWCAESKGQVTSDTEEGKALRKKIADHVQERDNENKDHGIELGFRYKSTVIVPPESDEIEPPWVERHYISSTWPGARAPHVFLKDKTTSIFDLFGQGPEFTLVDFTQRGDYIKLFQLAMASNPSSLPIKYVHLPDESHAHKVWERDAVLIRPDDHVAWRSSSKVGLDVDVAEVLAIVTGNHGDSIKASIKAPEVIKFASTIGNVQHNKVESLAAFQK